MQGGRYIIARIWPDFGGGRESRTDVILGLNPQKYDTIIIHLTKCSEKPNPFEQTGKKVFYLTRKPKTGFSAPFYILKLAKIFRAEGVDIVHCHKHKSTFYGVLAAMFAKVSIVISHVHGLGRTRNFKRRLLNRLLFKKVSRILAVGQAVKADVLATNPFLPAEKVINLGNSIDYGKFSTLKSEKSALAAKKVFNIDENVLVFATAGRLAETKGQKYLLAAFSIVKKEFANATLLLAGKGPLEKQLKQQSEELGLAEDVHFVGWLDDMTQFYNCADVFVLPSLAEGLPRGLLEAMAVGLPVIATSVGGIPEILDSGRYGKLVEPKNSAALAAAMLELAKLDDTQRTGLIAEQRKRVQENFSHSTVISRLEKIYSDEIEKMEHNKK